MEYLSTYGWTVLVIGIIIFGLYESNIFGGTSNLPTACVAQSGFLCSKPSMNTTGNVIVTFGEALGVPISITGTACINTTSAQPSSAFVTASTNIVQGQELSMTFQCPLPSNTIGTPFTGTL
ncbi:MAG: hypothetical protein M1321_02945 [Candidatus Marsarchaeota archaeon]|jgi:hypothetical protein|nr:hypothetical protein [Candidatus Marsarchaeota archaeon]